MGGSLVGGAFGKKESILPGSAQNESKKNERLLQILQRPFSYRYGVLKIDISCTGSG